MGNDMRVVLGVTMRNEVEYGPHVQMQLDDAIEMAYDAIVILDDGSTDGTWDILQEYAKSNNNIHIYRNEKNSVMIKGENRWQQLVRLCGEYDPTWINVRAADQLYCPTYKDKYREVLEYFYDKNIQMLSFPMIHLWRSEDWYRADRMWGRSVRQHQKIQIWRYYKDYSYEGRPEKAVLHQGQHIPSKLNSEIVMPLTEYIKPINSFFNLNDGNIGQNHFPFMVFHYGHTTHEKKEAKFRISMEVAEMGNAIRMPGPKEMPSVRKWLQYSFYPGFYEFGIKLMPINRVWFNNENLRIEEKPEIKPFTDLIAEYNKKIANEYQKMFEKYFRHHSKVKIIQDLIPDKDRTPASASKRRALFPAEGQRVLDPKKVIK